MVLNFNDNNIRKGALGLSKSEVGILESVKLSFNQACSRSLNVALSFIPLFLQRGEEILS